MGIIKSPCESVIELGMDPKEHYLLVSWILLVSLHVPETPDIIEDDLSMMSFPQPEETAQRRLERRLHIAMSSGGCCFQIQFCPWQNCEAT